jgi:phosphatidylserine/phosphatidylglycerophosphate/cardiolipin synthase-like enzyme
MIVIDPLSDDCTVITGSHNFSGAASEKNDENFVVIKNNKKLAQAYSVACLATYAHYRWRAYVHDQIAAKKKIWSHLSDKDTWQKDCLTDDVKATLAYWC